MECSGIKGLWKYIALDFSFIGSLLKKRQDDQPLPLFLYMKIFTYEAKKHSISGMSFYQNPMVDDITAALHPHAPYKGNYLVK